LWSGPQTLTNGGPQLDRWWLSVGLSSKIPNGSIVDFQVVMLLDGTIAEMTLLKGELDPPLRATSASKPPPTLGFPVQEPSTDGLNSPEPQVNSAGALADPEEKQTLYNTPYPIFTYKVKRSNLEAPRNAWNPRTQPFPADLRACAEKARQHLMNTREIRGSLEFWGVGIQWEPTSGPGGRSPCIIVKFQSTTLDGIHVPGPELFVVMLLDGTIAEMTLANGTLIYPFRTSPAAPQLQNRAPQSEVTEPPQ
jgi:hypothetical protein